MVCLVYDDCLEVLWVELCESLRLEQCLVRRDGPVCALVDGTWIANEHTRLPVRLLDGERLAQAQLSSEDKFALLERQPDVLVQRC